MTQPPDPLAQFKQDPRLTMLDEIEKHSSELEDASIGCGCCIVLVALILGCALGASLLWWFSAYR